MAEKWKGMIVAGGTGSRLTPLTLGTNKHLLPIWDKPMIYYPLSTLMLEGIRDIIIVTTPDAVDAFVSLLGDGDKWGINIEFVIQQQPGGIADTILCAQNTIKKNNVVLILGDNIFYGSGLPEKMRAAMECHSGATIFGYEVADPSSFGVVNIDENERPLELFEKPVKPVSNMAVPGLYFYDNYLVEIVKKLRPLERGELEITDVNKAYLQKKQLRVIPLGRGIAWLDGGTPNDMYDASQFVKVIEERTGLKVACPEEIAFRKGFIDKRELTALAQNIANPDYSSYLLELI